GRRLLIRVAVEAGSHQQFSNLRVGGNRIAGSDCNAWRVGAIFSISARTTGDRQNKEDGAADRLPLRPFCKADISHRQPSSSRTRCFLVSPVSPCSDSPEETGQLGSTAMKSATGRLI